MPRLRDTCCFAKVMRADCIVEETLTCLAHQIAAAARLPTVYNPIPAMSPSLPPCESLSLTAHLESCANVKPTFRLPLDQLSQLLGWILRLSSCQLLLSLLARDAVVVVITLPLLGLFLPLHLVHLKLIITQRLPFSTTTGIRERSFPSRVPAQTALNPASPCPILDPIHPPWTIYTTPSSPMMFLTITPSLLTRPTPQNSPL